MMNDDSDDSFSLQTTRAANSRRSTPSSRVYDAPLLDATEIAATDNFNAVDRASRNSASSTDEPYRQLMEAITTETDNSGGADDLITSATGSGSKNHTDAKSPSLAKLRFMRAAKKVQHLNMSTTPLQQATQKWRSQQKKTHRSNPSHAQDLLQSIQESTEENISMDGIFRDASQDPFLTAAHGDYHHHNFHKKGDSDSDENGGHYHATNDKGEVLPLSRDSLTSPRYGSVLAESLSGARRNSMHASKTKPTSSSCGRFCRSVAHFFSPRNACAFISNIVSQSIFVWVGIPLLVSGWILYYYVGNPELDFLPGRASLSWWCNFAARQLVMLELARFSQWLIVDVLILGTRIAVKLVGPFVTLLAIQARGWPFIVAAWSLWDMLLLHGDNNFQIHWFYWTGLAVYSIDEAHTGSYILHSAIYMRVLIAGLIAGSFSGLKRVIVTVKFSKRQCIEFKPRLEKLLAEMVLMTEVAALADQAEVMLAMSESDDSDDRTPTNNVMPAGKIDLSAHNKAVVRNIGDVQWGSISYHNDNSHRHLNDDDVQTSNSGSTAPMSGNSAVSRQRDVHKPRRGLSTTPSGSLRVKDMLDRWDIPVNKADKAEISISDVLKFKRALTYMDHDHPFGKEFGTCNDRDSCITSSHAVYEKLLQLSPENRTLSFEILELLIIDEEGNADNDKKRALRRLFRPDRHGKLSLLAFIQTCDGVYKRLRFFRASVGNASVIDNVLEGMFDGIFYFVLTLSLSSLLQFNPWALLVSITSLLVSISFALGPSVSKYVEGVLLIAIRRPYDLGDRICIGGAEVAPVGDSSSSTAFVEDINLTTTTLRYARTNEVSTLNNWAIAASRIVNCNRSPNAIVFIETMLHISIFENDTLVKFVTALKNYVKDNPRTWDSLAFCRHDNIDANTDKVFFKVAVRHRSSWQDAARIKMARSEFLKFMWETSKKLKVNFESPPPIRVIYQGGQLEKGEVQTYKKDLFDPSNIVSYDRKMTGSISFDNNSLHSRSESLRKVMDGE